MVTRLEDGSIRLKQGFVTAQEQPDVCQHGAARGLKCGGRAVGIVVFGSRALPWLVPIGVPMAVCELHFNALWLLFQDEEANALDKQRNRLINNVERYVNTEFA